MAAAPPVPPGTEVAIRDARGRFLGRGFYNPGTALCCRILTRGDEALDHGFFVRRIAAAVARRGGQGLPDGARRLVWSDADDLGGLVVDRYGPVLVVQCLTLGMAVRRDAIAAALREAVGDAPLFALDEPGPARLERFAPVRGWLGPPGPETVTVVEDQARLTVRLGEGHKTGLYLDQAENRVRAARLAEGHDVLDAFAYTAGFACHALLGGARRALVLESSAEAVEGARNNLRANGVVERAEIREVNAFDELRRLERGRERFGLVVLDPPPFARSRTTLEAAWRGYKEINLRAMRLLAPTGRLMTFSCSHHVTPGQLEAVCREAASDAGVALDVLAMLGQASDHPWRLAAPETRYLTGLLLERRPGG